MPKSEPEVRYEERVVTEYVPVIEKEEPKLTCERIAGCEVFPNAITEEEYCPTCVVK